MMNLLGEREQQTNPQQPLIDLMLLLQTVEIDTPESKLNETTMSDNKGNRIKY